MALLVTKLKKSVNILIQVAYNGREERKHSTALAKLMQQLLFYDIISIPCIYQQFHVPDFQII